MRIVMLEDVSVEVGGRGAKVHYFGGQTYEVGDEFGELCRQQKKARLHDEPPEDPEDKVLVAAQQRRMRLEKTKQEFALLNREAARKDSAAMARVKSKREAIKEELERVALVKNRPPTAEELEAEAESEAEAEAEAEAETEVSKESLTESEQECLKWQEQL